MQLEWLARVYFQNTMQQWLTSLAAALSLWLGLRILRRFILRRLEVISTRTATKIDDLILDLLRRTHTLFLLAWSFYASAQVFLHKTEKMTNLGHKAAFLISILQVGVWGNSIISFWVQHVLNAKASQDVAVATTIGLVKFLAKLALYSLLILLTLNNFGVDITALVAGLGVGGIAVALAVQNILGDLFASLTIVLDKPFIVGDFVVVGTDMGTIEHIGLKTTRARSLSGEQLIFSNTDLLKSRVRNFKRMRERRIIFTLSVVYETALNPLKRIPQMIREIIEAQKPVRFERAHFKAISAYALEFETVYWVLDADYTVYMNIQEQINLEILKRFRDENIQFAYPTSHVVSRIAEDKPT